jgi:asparagine synthetase B (glutamine-hydrolysing)
MCGIAGFSGRGNSAMLARMADAIAHCGPNYAGDWHSADLSVGLAHRRLSIIDLSPHGHQPKVVEVRVPFLDNDLVRLANALPPGLKQRGAEEKWVLKKAMEP